MQGVEDSSYLFFCWYQVVQSRVFPKGRNAIGPPTDDDGARSQAGVYHRDLRIRGKTLGTKDIQRGPIRGRGVELLSAAANACKDE